MKACSPPCALNCKQTAAQLRRNQLIHRKDDVAHGHQLVLRQQTLGRAGTAGDEHRLSFGRTGGIPGEMGRRGRRPPVLIQADEGRIDGEAGKIEVVRVAAERRGTILRREGEPHVGVEAVDIELELSAAIQRHHDAAPGRIAAADFTLDPPRLGIARRGERLAGQRTAGGLHAPRHVGDGEQDLGERARTLQFVFAAPRREAGFGVVRPSASRDWRRRWRRSDCWSSPGRRRRQSRLNSHRT